MTKDCLLQLHRDLFKLGYTDNERFAVVCAMHIAMDHIEDQTTIEKYGTIACDSILELKKELGV